MHCEVQCSTVQGCTTSHGTLGSSAVLCCTLTTLGAAHRLLGSTTNGMQRRPCQDLGLYTPALVAWLRDEETKCTFFKELSRQLEEPAPFQFSVQVVAMSTLSAGPLRMLFVCPVPTKITLLDAGEALCLWIQHVWIYNRHRFIGCTREHGAVCAKEREHMAPQRLPLAKLLQKNQSRAYSQSPCSELLHRARAHTSHLAMQQHQSTSCRTESVTSLTNRLAPQACSRVRSCALCVDLCAAHCSTSRHGMSCAAPLAVCTALLLMLRSALTAQHSTASSDCLHYHTVLWRTTPHAGWWNASVCACVGCGGGRVVNNSSSWRCSTLVVVRCPCV
jgi:hypothetical protein